MALEIIARYIGYLVVIGGALGFVIKVLGTLDKIADGTKCLMRSQLLSTYYKHEKEDEPTLRQFERENIDSLYDGYTSLKGNSFVIDIYDKMRKWRVVN